MCPPRSVTIIITFSLWLALSIGIAETQQTLVILCFSDDDNDHNNSRLAPAANQKSSHFFRNPAKSGSGKTSSWICQMPVQMQYFQLITDKTNADDLLSGVFAILISITRTKLHNPLLLHKFQQKTANSDVTEEALVYCLCIVADSIVMQLVSPGVLLCDPKNELSPNPGPAPAGFETVKFSNPVQP